jgi:hypothetical protein
VVLFHVYTPSIDKRVFLDISKEESNFVTSRHAESTRADQQEVSRRISPRLTTQEGAARFTTEGGAVSFLAYLHEGLKRGDQ